MRDFGDPASVAWHTGPPPKRPPTVPICRAKGGVQLRYALLSGVWVGVWVHNVDRRDTPCLGDTCPHRDGEHHRRATLKWYTDGLSLTSNRPCLVEATCEAMKPFFTTDGKMVGFARGDVVELRRAGLADHSRGQLLRLPAVVDAGGLPAPFDVRLALTINWAGDTKKGHSA